MALFSRKNLIIVITGKKKYAKLFERIKLTIYNGFHIPTKGQTISKANYGLLNSPKKRTKCTQDTIDSVSIV